MPIADPEETRLSEIKMSPIRLISWKSYLKHQKTKKA